MKNTILALLMTLTASLGLAQLPVAGQKVFVESNDDYSSFYTAAMLIKRVPLTITTMKDQADFVISISAESQKAGWAKMVFERTANSAEQLSVVMSNPKTGDVVWSCSANKPSAIRGKRSAAEACAKLMNRDMFPKK